METIQGTEDIAVIKSLSSDKHLTLSLAIRLSLFARILSNKNQINVKFFKYYYSMPKKIGRLRTKQSFHKQENPLKSQGLDFFQ